MEVGAEARERCDDIAIQLTNPRTVVEPQAMDIAEAPTENDSKSAASLSDRSAAAKRHAASETGEQIVYNTDRGDREDS